MIQSRWIESLLILVIICISGCVEIQKNDKLSINLSNDRKFSAKVVEKTKTAKILSYIDNHMVLGNFKISDEDKHVFLILSVTNEGNKSFQETIKSYIKNDDAGFFYVDSSNGFETLDFSGQQRILVSFEIIDPSGSNYTIAFISYDEKTGYYYMS